MSIEIRRTTVVQQGDVRIGSDPGEVLTTVLGSCVATCLYDPRRGAGGMNHFLLPTGDERQARFGLHAMELLINGLLKGGSRRGDLLAKAFGGARMHDGLGEIGTSNAAFVRRFFADEGIRCVASSLGGDRARRVRFWPATGRAQMMLLDRDIAPPRPRPAPPPMDDVTFF